ncbi:ATP-binding cassette domain-containing protein [Pedobacter sp. SYP-B3415]|uniref:ATP-binding cassette domain-containing protein n=1 Tax=Pedobacter sp. SYP-B3415 TaxID=2496641 RepID=UPI00101CE568|nr:ATP-binding cassette domain-containing protein [Pedobacter sp. SYP-B3415]
MQTLTADSVSKNYGRRQLLNGVFLHCQTGKITGLLGRNGCGKSTLLKIIYGTEPAAFKHVRINGMPYNKPYRSGLLHLLSQNYEVPGRLRIATFIRLCCNIYYQQIAGLSFVAQLAQRRVKDLSGGERRFLFVLAAIYSDALFVLLDEPFSHLSPVFANTITEHMHIMKQHKGFVVTDHLYRQLIDCSDELILLHNGSNYRIRHREDLVTHGYLSSPDQVAGSRLPDSGD